MHSWDCTVSNHCYRGYFLHHYWPILRGGSTAIGTNHSIMSIHAKHLHVCWATPIPQRSHCKWAKMEPFHSPNFISFCKRVTSHFSPEVIEVCKLQGSISLSEELAVTLVIHVCLHSFGCVKGFSLLVAPQADLPNSNLLSCMLRGRNNKCSTLTYTKLNTSSFIGLDNPNLIANGKTEGTYKESAVYRM